MQRRLSLVISLALLVTVGCAASPAPMNVRSCGALGDGKTKDTAAFQKAIDQCSAGGGGQLVVPAGNYLLGSIELKSNTTLQLDKDATLTMSPDAADFPLIQVRWEGRWVDGHRGFIYASNAQHIGVVGAGKIVGNPAVGRSRSPRGPALIEPVACDGVILDGISTDYDRMWNIHPVYCQNVVARNLHVHSKSGQSDGIDIDSTQHVLVENCVIDTGDDCVAIKSGRGEEGFKLARPSEHIMIRNCTFASGFAGVGIGSEMSGGVRDVHVEDCTVTRAINALYLKSRIGRGGFIENVSGKNLNGTVSRAFLRIDLMGRGLQDSQPVPGDDGIPQAQNISLTDCKVDCQTLVDASMISATKPLVGLSIANITGTCKRGILLSDIVNADLSGINVSGYDGPLLSVHNVTGTGLEGGVAFTPATAPSSRPRMRTGAAGSTEP